MRKSILIALLSVSITIGAVGIMNAQTGTPEVMRNYNTLEVDNFDKEGYWQAKYSRFRSLNWESTWGNIPQYTPVYERQNRRDSTITPNDQWLRWSGDSEGFEVIPDGLKDQRADQAAGNVLGIRGNWDFPGYNWVMIEPAFTRSAALYQDSPKIGEGKTACSDGQTIQNPCTSFTPPAAGNQDAEPPYAFLVESRDYNPASERTKLLPNYIQIPGRSEAIDFWIWGKGYHYNLEVQVEDFYGNAHTLRGPSLNYFGWRNVRMEIPRYIPQTQRYLPQSQGIRFLRFKIIASPDERPDDFVTYIDFMQVLTDMYVQPFFGDDLISHPTWDQN